jgi:hypothetical protein
MIRNTLKSLTLALVLAAGAAPALAQGTAFTYQGQLNSAGVPVNGPIDFQFRLYTAATGGSQVGDPVIATDVNVAAGLFSTPLDFGADAFAIGRPLFLDILVRDAAGSGVFTPLGARQPLTPAPFSLATRGINVDAAGDVSLLAGAPRTIRVPEAAVDANGQSLSILAGDSNPSSFFATLGGDLVLEAGNCLNIDQPGVLPGNVIIRSGGNFLDTGFGLVSNLPNGGDIIFEAGAQDNTSVERMRLTQAGALGLGTTLLGSGIGGPEYKLHVVGSGTTTDSRAPYGMFQTTDGNFGPQLRLKHGGAGGQDWVMTSAGSGNGASGSLLFVRSGSPVIPLAISASDDVGIGTATPTARLHNAGTTRLDQELQFGVQNFTGTTGSNAKLYRFGAGGNVTNLYLDMTASAPGSSFIFQANGNDRFSFDLSNGTALKTGGGAWGVLSDERTKTDIQPMTGTLDRLLQLKGHSYTYKPEFVQDGRALPGMQIGLVAQEVETVFPDWVTTGQDGLKQVTERSTTALMVEALRDLRTEKDSEIANLKVRLEKLEAYIAAQSGVAAK